MNRIVYLFFVLIAGAVSARAQEPFHLTLPSAQPAIRFPSLPDTLRGLRVTTDGRVRVLKPDRMSCLLPDLSRVEQMPILWSLSVDPMPNGAEIDEIDKYSSKRPLKHLLHLIPGGK